jgi:nicotinamidase-related amidase
MKYPQNNTALLLVDPLNDFMSVWGKGYPLARKITKQVNLHQNLDILLTKFRSLDWPVFYAPHFSYKPGSFTGRKYLHPSEAMQKVSAMFKADAFGSRFYPDFAPQPQDVVASEHSCSSGFMGTNLHEKLQEKNITHLVVVGFLANSCIESTVRSAMDLDYHVTLLRDGVSAWTPEDLHAAVDQNYPLIANILTNTESLTKALEVTNA